MGSPQVERSAINELLDAPSEKLVCKYMKPCTAIENVVLGRLRMGRFKEMNDPREASSNRFECNAFSGEIPADKFDVQEEFNEAVVSSARVLCGARDKYKKCDKKRVTHRGFGKPRMWATYGDEHKGACFVFDRESLKSKIREQLPPGTVWARDVDYNPMYLKPGYFHADYELMKKCSPDAIKSCAEKFQLQLFFRKHEDWKTECEWRIATIDTRPRDLLVEFSRSLKYVVLGYLVKDQTIEAIREISPVPVLRLSYEFSKEDFVLNTTVGSQTTAL